MTFAKYVKFPLPKKCEEYTSPGYPYSLVGLWMRDQFDGEVNCASSYLAIDISFSFAYSTHTNLLCSHLLQPRFQGFFVTKC